MDIKTDCGSRGKNGPRRMCPHPAPGEEDAGNDRTRVVYCGPWGVAYTPPSYAQAVTVETRQGIACVGTVMEKPEEGMVEPGELLLFSKGAPGSI